MSLDSVICSESIFDCAMKSHTSSEPSFFAVKKIEGRVGDQQPEERYVVSKGVEKIGTRRSSIHRRVVQSPTERKKRE